MSLLGFLFFGSVNCTLEEQAAKALTIIGDEKEAGTMMYHVSRTLATLKSPTASPKKKEGDVTLFVQAYEKEKEGEEE